MNHDIKLLFYICKVCISISIICIVFNFKGDTKDNYLSKK